MLTIIYFDINLLIMLKNIEKINRVKGVKCIFLIIKVENCMLKMWQ